MEKKKTTFEKTKEEALEKFSEDERAIINRYQAECEKLRYEKAKLKKREYQQKQRKGKEPKKRGRPRKVLCSESPEIDHSIGQCLGSLNL